jgi:hypothetical protein
MTGCVKMWNSARMWPEVRESALNFQTLTPKRPKVGMGPNAPGISDVNRAPGSQTEATQAVSR